MVWDFQIGNTDDGVECRAFVSQLCLQLFLYFRLFQYSFFSELPPAPSSWAKHCIYNLQSPWLTHLSVSQSCSQTRLHQLLLFNTVTSQTLGQTFTIQIHCRCNFLRQGWRLWDLHTANVERYYLYCCDLKQTVTSQMLTQTFTIQIKMKKNWKTGLASLRVSQN